MSSMVKERLNQLLQRLIDVLEKEDGRSYEEKKAEILAILAEDMKQTKAEKRKRPRKSGAAIVRAAITQQRFWADGETLRLNDELWMRKVEKGDKEEFLALTRIYSPMAASFDDASFCNIFWKERTGDSELMCSIFAGDSYIGYCSIADLTQDLWEVSIELLPAWTGRGIGQLAMTALLDAAKERLGVTDFRVRIDAENTASQKLFTRLGAVPNGISELWLHGEEELQRFEEKNLHRITAEMTALAETFGVEPRKLLSHVLEYRLHWD